MTGRTPSDPDSAAPAVVLCCAEEDESTLALLVSTLRERGLNPEVLGGVDMDTTVLGKAMDQRPGPGLFILCESDELDSFQVRRLEGVFSARKGPLHRSISLDPRKDPVATTDEVLAALQGFGVPDAVESEDNSLRDVVGATDLDALSSGPGPDVVTSELPAVDPSIEIDLDADEPADEPDETAAPVSAPGASPSPAPEKRFPLLPVLLVLALLGGAAYFVLGQGPPKPVDPAARAPALAKAAETRPEPEPAQRAAEAPAPATVEPTPADTDTAPPAADATDAAAAEDPGAPPEGATSGEPAAPDPGPEAEAEAELDAEPEAPAAPDTLATDEGPLDEALAAALARKQVEVVEGYYIHEPRAPEMTWKEAANFCKKRKHWGEFGWRLPRASILRKLRIGGHLRSGAYWSSTLVDVDVKDEVYIVDTARRGVYAWLKAEPNAHPVCVKKSR